MGFDKPSYLSINTSNELEVASNAVSETTPVLVKLTGINRIDSEDFAFYLVIRQAIPPIWRDVDALTMTANTTFNLFDIVEGADSISRQSGPTGSSVSEGVLTVGTASGDVVLRATNTNGNTDTTISINVVQRGDASNFSDTFRYHVEIAGIDVSDDLKVLPTVSESLDAVRLNVNTVNRTSFTLRSDSSNGFRYNAGIDGNFWAANSLNPSGFQAPIVVYLESLVNGEYVRSLLFSGNIREPAMSINDAEVQLRADDISAQLRNALISDFGTLEKWDRLRQQSDEATFEGVYAPEGSLLPMQLQSGKAWEDRTALTLSEFPLPSEGPPQANTAHLTAADLRTSGGFLESDPILTFKTTPRSEDVKFLFKQLSIHSEVYQIEIDIPVVERSDPFILNRGSVPFSVENTRITRLPTDWIYDSTNDRLLILLSNPEAHISDLLVQYDLTSDAYRILHTFDSDISVHRIARRTSTDYYLFAARAIGQNRSAPTLPRPIDSTGYAYDSIAEGSEIKILRYNALTETLTEHVDADDTRPPQLGIHYPVGFENALYIDEFEGIRPEYRGAFKFYNSQLYYRYATPSGFGVARVNTSGTTTEMIDQTTLNYNNHLNFAFDINSSGDIYFVYATGDEDESSLVIKRRISGGTESTILTETRGVGDFNDVGNLDFGAFLGAYEALFHNNNLYILAPIQKVDFGDDYQSIINPDVNIEQLTAEKTGERNVTTSTNLNPSNLTLAPGDDIPLRIDFDGTVTGATQSDLTVYGGTIESFSISSDMIDVTIRPDSKSVHKTIIVDLAEDAVDQTNEAWRITIDFETTRSRTKAAGMALYKCNATDNSPSLTLIEHWDFVTRGGCNLVVHDDAVHFVEHPPTSQVYTPYNPDLDSYSEDMGYNILPEALGALKKVDSSDAVESLGNLWYEARAWNVAQTPCLSIDGDLHLTMGYGVLDAVLRQNSLASKADNAQHLVYGTDVQYVLPEFEASGSIYRRAFGTCTKCECNAFY